MRRTAETGSGRLCSTKKAVTMSSLSPKSSVKNSIVVSINCTLDKLLVSHFMPARRRLSSRTSIPTKIDFGNRSAIDSVNVPEPQPRSSTLQPFPLGKINQSNKNLPRIIQKNAIDPS